MNTPAATPADRWCDVSVEALRSTWGVPRLLVFDVVGSTNAVARELAMADAPHGTTVIAEHQTAGQGRQGREWIDQAGASLLLSMVLRPRVQGGSPTLALPLLVGAVCAFALRAATELHVGIEWPNDLVIGDRKLGGILCEAGSAGIGGDYVVAGIGINVDAVSATVDPTRRPTSLFAERGGPTDRVSLAGHLMRGLLRLRADAPLTPRLLEEIRSLDSLLDRPVRFGTGRNGIARGILPDGALLVESDGERVEVRSGSVSPVGRATP